MAATDRVNILASDHRWQWEEWCDTHVIDRRRISEVKAIVVDAFLAARTRSDTVARAGSLLLDQQYAAAQIARAKAAGVRVGAPVEKAGVSPLEWAAAEVFAAAPPGAFVKVLIKDRPDADARQRADQFDKLIALQRWCRSHGAPLLVEIIVPRQREAEATFEEVERPAMLAATIRDAYTRGLEPEYWKIEGTTSAGAAAIVDRAIGERSGPRQIILGKGAGMDLIARWFATAAPCRSASGFAIGRSVFWEPGTAFLEGRIDAAGATEAIASAYLKLVDMWQAAALT